MERIKVVRDLVHGYIEIDTLEEKIINTPHFQRLKDIRQLTCQHVFPTATHNRFEHSLGVMHLANEAFENLKKSLSVEHKIEEAIYNKLLFHLKIAALLHDVGHAPYSHLGERYYLLSEIRRKISEIIKKNDLKIDGGIFSHGSKHELMSCYILFKKYHDVIESGKKNISVDFELICRCIIGANYTETSKWPENIIIELLNSKKIDTDKLDYLMRDAYMTGVSVPPIDIGRLYKYIYINPSTKSITFCSQALPVIQNIIDA